jgi:hypothetical protein
MQIDFPHKQSAHCENGVVSNLMRFQGYDFDEPMVFGIGSGIFFSYIPFIKMNGIPVTSYRILPGAIFSRFTRRLGIKIESHTYSSKEKAMYELDAMLGKGVPVGMLSSVFYLSYLPDAYRFHFNAHNIVVYGKEGNNYLVSDPVMDYTTAISSEDLIRARFAKGVPEPKGKMYYPVMIPKDYHIEQAIWLGIKRAGFDIAEMPMPIFGANGMRYMARRLRTWPEKLGNKKAIQYLGNIVRMQEEIGTGGAGFRFIYAAFLAKAGKIVQYDELLDLSKQLTATGDKWRHFAYYAGRVCKSRKSDLLSFAELSDIVMECADEEARIFGRLYQIAREHDRRFVYS